MRRNGGHGATTESCDRQVKKPLILRLCDLGPAFFGDFLHLSFGPHRKRLPTLLLFNQFLLLFRLPRITAIRQERACGISGRTGLRQSHLRIHADRQQFLSAIHPIFEMPQT